MDPGDRRSVALVGTGTRHCHRGGDGHPEYVARLGSLLESIQEYTDYDGVMRTTTQGTVRVESFDLWVVLSVTLEMSESSVTKEYCMGQGALMARAFDSFLADES